MAPIFYERNNYVICNNHGPGWKKTRTARPDILTATAHRSRTPRAATHAARDILEAYDEENPRCDHQGPSAQGGACVYSDDHLGDRDDCLHHRCPYNEAQSRPQALASAYTIATEAAARYRDKVIEGRRRREGQGGRRRRSPTSSSRRIRAAKQPIVMGTGKKSSASTPLSSRYFMSDMESPSQGQNDMNKIILDDMYASLNDFYYRSVSIPESRRRTRLDQRQSHRPEILTLVRRGQPCLVVNYESTVGFLPQVLT